MKPSVYLFPLFVFFIPFTIVFFSFKFAFTNNLFFDNNDAFKTVLSPELHSLKKELLFSFI